MYHCWFLSSDKSTVVVYDANIEGNWVCGIWELCTLFVNLKSFQNKTF